MADNTLLAEHFVDAMPEAAARILEACPPAAVSSFVDRIPDALSSKALASMLSFHAAQCLNGLTDEAAARYLKPLPAQTVVAILRHLTPDRRRRLLSALTPGLGARVGLLIRYSKHTVGAWMDPSPPALPWTCRATEALARLKEHDGRQQADVFLVDGEEKLRGVVTLAAMVWAEPETPISELAGPVSHSLAAGSTLANASRHIGWDTADRLPVVDRAKRLIGVLRHAALRTGLTRESETAPPHPVPTEDVLELTSLWYQGLAGTLNSTLARTEHETDAPGTK